jgi:hypothetical protein
LRQCWWLELIKDYDVVINYHPGKTNVVADALSSKKHCNAMAARELSPELCKEFEELSLAFVNELSAATMEVDSILEANIRKGQLKVAKFQEIKQLIKSNKTSGFSEDEHGTLWQGNRSYVPDMKEIHELIHSEAYDSAYSIHPGCTKKYQDLKTHFWWHSMKRDVNEYVALCGTCQRVKAEHQRPAGLLQPLKIPDWKWEEINMDFIVGLPRTQFGYD